ncbi:fimbria/pilus outer membrane usher protein [Enterobacter mori]|uniref:fimbria/pilus outer membrane usher protein n=1 Tax=Enterobacter mori TaxID=539813 RepID=UPI002B201BCE|nr:fimbria/pilus outer membrane usher protein [Enterobacter mori]MEA5206345.1 fimbria/pilus outer membrane usher protein [Enterobacter mori]
MLLLCLLISPFGNADDIEFNADILDVEDRKNMDLSQFSRAGYIMPGNYQLAVKINGHSLSQHDINYRDTGVDAGVPEPLLNKELVSQFGLKKEYEQKLEWGADGGLRLASLPGMQINTEMADSSLNISIPQIFLEYTSANWDPPSRWDNGVTGLLLDYNLNAGTRRDNYSGERHSITGNGTLGANVGAWRLRADWQLQDLLTDSAYQKKGVEWSRYYMYRALPDWRAKLTLGESYLTSDIFDSFRYAGASLESDVSMLPPTLRGYAPEVNGVAESNATVVISQQGRVLYQTQVAPGPFSIQDLNSSVNGTLDVEIREQDGKVTRYQVSTASLPYLTRPGTVRYKIFSGRPVDWQHAAEGPYFAATEASWGVSNGWSLYGGAIGSDGYQSFSVGIGRDLFMLGALSSDVTVARSQINDNETRQGKSFRVSYAKTFEEYSSQITFAGYRFSEEDFYSMPEYLSAKKGYGNYTGNNKERYDITFNKRFIEQGLSAYFSYSHQSYWNRPASDRFELSLNSYFDVAGFKNMSVSARAYRQSYYGQNDDGMMLSLNVPWGDKGYVSYSGNYTRHDNSHSLGYSGRTEENGNYNLRATSRRHDTELSGYWNQQGAKSDISLSATGNSNSSSAANVNLSGGATATRHGVVLHGGSGFGGTRLMIDTDGIADVPLQGSGRTAKTNGQGLAVITGVSSYNRTHTNVAVDKLGDEMEATDSVAQLTLTEGAIGYRQLEVVAGQKGLATLRLQDGSAPPFGASVLTSKGKSAGIIGDDGQIWLSGIKPGEKMRVQWDGATQCEITLPEDLAEIDNTSLLLPCVTGA